MKTVFTGAIRQDCARFLSEISPGRCRRPAVLSVRNAENSSAPIIENMRSRSEYALSGMLPGQCEPIPITAVFGLPMKKFLAACALGLMLSAGAPCASAADLLVLPPTVITAVRSAQDVHAAVLQAARKYKWKVMSDRPGLVVLEYRRGDKLGVTISVSYTPKKFRIAYVKSFGLGYEKVDGRETIHRKYNKWITALEKEIRGALY